MPAALRAQRAVIPASMPILPVGGINVGSFKLWTEAGASGFGVGSALYQPGRPANEIAQAASRIIAGWRSQAHVE